ncbi:hypothetical protein [Nostoc sp. 106C]|nr:hypothetical protein [Nostoc sp. 106C]
MTNFQKRSPQLWHFNQVLHNHLRSGFSPVTLHFGETYVYPKF